MPTADEIAEAERLSLPQIMTALDSNGCGRCATWLEFLSDQVGRNWANAKTERESLSGLLRGMARRVGNLRKNGRHFTDITEKLQDTLDSALIERDDLQTELTDVDRLRRNHDALADAYVGAREALDNARADAREAIGNRDSTVNRLLGVVAAVRKLADDAEHESNSVFPGYVDTDLIRAVLDGSATQPASSGIVMGTVTGRSVASSTALGSPLPRRDDHIATWIKATRDRLAANPAEEDHPSGWYVLDELLEDWRLHADTGTPIDQHACEGSYCCAEVGEEVGSGAVSTRTPDPRAVDFDRCPEPPAVDATAAVEADTPEPAHLRVVDDGFGNEWSKCARPECGLEVVRPGKTQCWCDSGPGYAPHAAPCDCGCRGVNDTAAGSVSTTPAEPAPHDGDSCADMDRWLDEAHGDLNDITTYLARSGITTDQYRTAAGVNYRRAMELLVASRVPAAGVSSTPDPSALAAAAHTVLAEWGRMYPSGHLAMYPAMDALRAALAGSSAPPKGTDQ